MTGFASLVGVLMAVIAVAVLMAACDNGPERVVGTGPTAPSPSALPVVVSLEISGPASIPPGQSAQFAAISRLSDGTSEPASVRWNLSSATYAEVLRVDASGLATAGPRGGEAVLSAALQASPIRSSKEVLVLPAGTYRMVGVVTEAGPEATPIFGARVEVTGGAVVPALTDYDGRYGLYGVPGIAEVRVIEDGHRPHLQSFRLAEHVTQNFQLSLAGTRLDLAGPYTLDIDTGCEPVETSAGLLDLRHLRYEAFLTQSGPTLEVVLTESSRFRVDGAGRGHRFSGRVDSAGATFNLRGASWYDFSTYPDLIERVPDGTFLVVEGTLATVGSRAGLSGVQPNLSFYRLDSRWPAVAPDDGSFVEFCSANLPVRFTLTPR
jgi:hypothetical protein